ncbi:MAG: carbohydrate kinase family protein [archaeon]
MYDVITVGSSTIDVFAGVESELIKIKTAHHEEDLIAYPSGSKILIKDLTFLTGGGGTNTAVACSKLGLKTAYLGKMGKGSNSNLIIKNLRKEKVDFIGTRTNKFHAGYSVILDSLDNDRTILTYKGANNELSFKEINLKKIKAKWFYFSSMVGKSYLALEDLAEYASKKKIKIAFNPSNYLAVKGEPFLRKLLSSTYLLVLNMEEACLIAGKLQIQELILKLQGYGPKIVVVTDGKNGAFTIHGNKLLHVIPSKIKAKETTGAGDAFASTFMAGLIKGKDVETSLKMGIRNAESVICNMGAKNGLLKYRVLLDRIRKNPPKIEKKTVASNKHF